MGMGYSQGETNCHTGVEGQGHFLNRGAREIHWLQQFHNEDICGGNKAPHRSSMDIMKLPGCSRGVLGFALALLCLPVAMSSVQGPSSIVLFPISLVQNPPSLLSSKLHGPTSCPYPCTFGVPN